MSEQEISKLKKHYAEEVARLKQLHEREVAKLQKTYAREIHLTTQAHAQDIEAHTKQHERDQDRIKGLLAANAKGLKKRVTKPIPKSFKPLRAGGNPETN